MSFPKYPEYKDSGVEWLGEVPAHWEVKRLRYVAELNPSKSEVRSLPAESSVSFIPMEAVGEDGALSLDQMRPIGEVLAGYTYVREGDVSIAKITPCFENGKGAVMRGLENRVGFGTTELIVMRPKARLTTSNYLYRVVSSEPFRVLGESSMYGAGGQKRVPDDFVRNFTIAWPPYQEQAVIQAFLDHETARIDALVEEQQRLIVLLKEKRQAVISHAVTKGLDPDVPMKDSGVEWLGKVPAHWEVSRLKHVTDRIIDCPHETPVYDLDGDFLVIRTADLEYGVLDPQLMYRLDEGQYKSRTRRSTLGCGDIVYGREGERWGHAALVPENDKYCLGQRMMQFIPSHDMCPEFLMWQLNSDNVYRQGDVDVVGATSPHVNVSTIKNYFISVPLKKEQLAISKFLNEESSAFDKLVHSANSIVALLKERRSALISAAVTGKIDVRGWQPPSGSPAHKTTQTEMV
ncbi:restriction endonuclease subunit S [Halomonas sp. SSL-5]|uniref:restriction endonuclease subunit S n=1 Tax=Halomonas sp. SSL-5 TaxID=3065855 RepID=UPI0027387C5E|nr:restriction endonuclease subunit S [Halomonas sp. SSL-5]MDY7115529.1 restriction endonuclease subunit S [Halomonas sp. SSL-5]